MLKIISSEPFDGLFPFLAPDTGSDDGVTDDDPNDPDDDEDGALKDVFAAEGDLEEDEDQEEDEAEEESKDEEEEDPEKKTDPKLVTMTQEEFDAKIEARLQRDRDKRERETAERTQIEAETKRQIDEESNYLNNFYTRKVQTLINIGYPEEDARIEAGFETKREQRLIQLDRSDRAREQESRQTQGMMAYQAEKSMLTAKYPLAAKYVAEIEAVGKGGSIPGLTFETAMKYVLGEKVASGELLKDVRAGERQKTLANEQKSKKAKVEGGSQPGDTSKQVNLTPQERKLAKAFGLSAKEWAAEKQKQQKRNKR